MFESVLDDDWARQLPGLAVASCWAVLVAVWLVGAVYNARNAPVARRRQRLGPAWLMGIAAYALVTWAIPGRMWTPLTIHIQWLLWTGVALLVAATAFTVWARTALGSMWTSSPVVKEGHVLRTQGPYGITRHPIYTGICGMIAATTMTAGLGRWIPVTLFALLLLVIKARAEERMLESALGDEYRRYRRRVHMLVPVPRRDR